jgi:hypothetical protein
MASADGCNTGREGMPLAALVDPRTTSAGRRKADTVHSVRIRNLAAAW